MRYITFADRVIVAIASLAITLQGLNVPEKFWDDHGYALVISIIVVFFFGVVTPFETLQGRSLEKEREQAWKNGLSALDDANRDSGIDLRELAVHVWLIKRTIKHPISGRLGRPISIRIGHQGANRSVPFGQGKGVVGRCWQRNDEVELDVRSTYAGIGSQADWDHQTQLLGDDFTWGLTYDEYTRTEHLAAIIAIPLDSVSGRFIGCVSADCTTGDLPTLRATLPAIRRYRDWLQNLPPTRIRAR